MTTTVEFGTDKYHLQRKMGQWCTDHIFENPVYTNWVYAEPTEWKLGTWAMSTTFGSTFFYFKHKSDATMFALRWS